MISRTRLQGSVSALLALAALCTGSPPLLRAQQSPLTQIIVERRVGKTVQQMGPQHVFSAGDWVRFRFRSSFGGYLYVTDQSTSGKYLVLYPGPATGEVSELKPNVDYVVPATAGSWFRVDNPPGYETIFFLVSPTELKGLVDPRRKESPDAVAPLPPPPQAATPSEDLLPRCDDAIFQARGDCVDVLAGPRMVPREAQVPGNLSAVPDAGSRGLTIINKAKSSVIAPTDSEQAPFIYEFRLAHH